MWLSLFIRLILALLVLFLFVFGWYVLIPAYQDPVKFFVNRRSVECEVQTLDVENRKEITIESLAIRGVTQTGIEVKINAFCCSPQSADMSLPAFVLLGGLITGRDAILEISERPEIAMRGVFIALDYPYQGPTSFQGFQILPHLPRIRRALFDGVEALRLALDYLEQQPEVDQRRIVLLGVSLGAFYAVDAAALDQRPAAVIAYMGGGDLTTLMAWNLRQQRLLPSGLLSSPVAWLAGLLVRPLEPTRLAPRIAPRLYLQVSAREDEQVPVENALSLYRAASHPKELIWITAPHLQPGRDDIVEQMIAIADRELTRWGLLKGASP